jgi:hypothetical protein
MIVELIAVLELHDPVITGRLSPYHPALPFYRLCDLSDDMLKAVVLEHTAALHAGEYERDDACPLFGGYVLRIDNEDKLFPQCCGDLSDIVYWRRLSDGQHAICEGHPAPEVEFQGDMVRLDCAVWEHEESFVPRPPENIIIIKKTELQKAVQHVMPQLKMLGRRILTMEQEEALGIPDIDYLLNWNSLDNYRAGSI